MEALVKDKQVDGSKLVVPEAREPRSSPHALPVNADLMQSLAAAASNPNIDAAKLTALYAIKKDIEDRAAKQLFHEAMARAQARIAPVIATSWNDQTKSNYAKLEAIDRAITPIHTSEGLSVSYDTETKNDADPVPTGMVRIIAMVRHAAGHEVRHHIDLPPDEAGARGNTNKTMVHALGSTNTYGRRYLKMMIFNVSTFDDKDGNRSKGAKGGQMEDNILTDHLAAMDEAANEADLMKAFGKAWNAADEIKDEDAKRTLTTKRDECRKKLKQGRRS